MKWILLLLCFCIALKAEDVPLWVMKGILRVESNSYYDANGILRYVDRKIGANHEIGPFQITRRAFLQVRGTDRRGFGELKTDVKYSEEITIRYLKWLRKHYASTWYKAIEMYNAGPGHKAPAYLKKVLNAASL